MRARIRRAAAAATLAAKNLLGRSRWSIAIYAGDDPLQLAPAAPAPVLTGADVADALATFVADPFMIEVDGTWHMFFEALVARGRSRVGVICHATSRDAVSWAYDRIVLAEEFHLSYPHVFRAGSELYMVPESSAARAVRLYRADPFPRRWVLEAELLRGEYYDSTLFEEEGRWWMFTAPTLDDRLALFHAASPRGPWREHPMSPVRRGDPRRCRPAGPLVRRGGALVRFAQDCVPLYGTGVRGFEILELSPERYAERELQAARVLGPGTARWNSRGMHQLDAHPLPGGRWIACVDGWYRGLVGPREIARALGGAITGTP